MSISTVESFDNSSHIFGNPDNVLAAAVNDTYGCEQIPVANFDFRSHSACEMLPPLELLNSRQSDLHPSDRDVAAKAERAAVLNQMTNLIAVGRFLHEDGTISNPGLNLIQQFMERTPRKQSYEAAAVQLQSHLYQALSAQAYVLPPSAAVAVVRGLRLAFQRVGGDVGSSMNETGSRSQYRPHILSIQIGEATQRVPVRILSSSSQ